MNRKEFDKLSRKEVIDLLEADLEEAKRDLSYKILQDSQMVSRRAFTQAQGIFIMLFAILAVVFLVYMSSYDFAERMGIDSIKLPSNLAGSIIKEDSRYVRIDVSTPEGYTVYKNLQEECRDFGVTSCMSAEDILGLKK